MNLIDLSEMQQKGEYKPAQLPITPNNSFPLIPRKTVLKSFSDGGEIRLELGADGTWLQFDCECADALPYCHAQCCALIGTTVLPDELAEFNYPVDFDPTNSSFVLHRDADGFCACLNREKRTCDIYDHRPQTCKNFHCTRSADTRGWKLANHVSRHSMY